MSERKERQDGFYFVRISNKTDAKWRIGYYSSKYDRFQLTGDTFWYYATDFAEIDERRVERAEEQKVTGCSDCPLYYADDSGEIKDCQHPQGISGSWQSEIFEKCPLKLQPIQITLDRSE